MRTNEFFAQLDVLLSDEARTWLEAKAEYYTNDVLVDGRLPNLHGLNDAELRCFWADREAAVARLDAEFDDRLEAEGVEADRVFEAVKQRVFHWALRRAQLRLPSMVRRCEDASLRQWCKQQLRAAHGSELKDEAHVYLYLTLRSMTEWAAAHEEGFEGLEDRFADSMAGGQYDGGIDPFLDERSAPGYECAQLSKGEFAVMVQSRPDMVAA